VLKNAAFGCPTVSWKLKLQVTPVEARLWIWWLDRAGSQWTVVNTPVDGKEERAICSPLENS
jgi:hypothetical protein